MGRNKKGFVYLLLPVLALIIVGVFGVVFFLNRDTSTNLTSSLQSKLGGGPQAGEGALSFWKQDENGWRTIGEPPACPNPLELPSPVDLSKATSVLYPGQMRSVGYENTAGFRFDGERNEAIVVTAPMDGEVIQAARFIAGGDIQYVFDILSSCGIMTRFDHLLRLTPKFQEIADGLPEPKENDSRSTFINPPVKVSSGEVIATAVGIASGGHPQFGGVNTFVAWTVFDFRAKNKASLDSSWASEHPTLDHYVVCPYDYLSSQDQELVKGLPASDSMSGTKSDFCE